MSRSTDLFTFLLLTCGLTGGTFGMVTDHDDLGWFGLFLTAATMPAVVHHSIRNAQRVSTSQLAEAHNAGYRLALEHVARGLLDPPAAPDGPGEQGKTTAPNVYRLRPRHRAADDKRKRKAQ